MKSAPDVPRGNSYALTVRPLPLSMVQSQHTLEVEGEVEAKLLKLNRRLFLVLLAEKPDIDGLGFEIDVRLGSAQPLDFPQRLPGARVGKMALPFPAGCLADPNRHVGIFDADGQLFASGVVLATGKTSVFRLPSVRIYPAARPDLGPAGGN